ncbi:MAG: hypothetical protein HYR56_13390 [Acidobacteria bacterium]|nr:hypothetical protein [Acidobacteriota bacterium]MBI3424667.1 hypothetical protein [Acidobacteriota bacterium]
MTNKAKVASAIVALALLFVTMVVGGYWYWLTQNRAGLKQSQAQGLAYGKQTDDQGCWETALRRQKQVQDYKGMLQNNSFLLACLAAAANPPQFCADVPMPGEIIRGTRWTLERCARPEMQALSTSDCKGLLATLQTYCSEYYKR